MMTLLLSFAVFLLAMLAMALGVIISGRRIEGSCGGLNRVPGVDSDCGGACRRPCAARRRAMAEASQTDRGHRR